MQRFPKKWGPQVVHGFQYEVAKFGMIWLPPKTLSNSPYRTLLFPIVPGMMIPFYMFKITIIMICHNYIIVKGSLEAKLPTVWRDGKAQPQRSEDMETVRRKRSEMEKIRQGHSHKREDADARKGTNLAKNCVFPMICGSRGSKSGLAKAAGVEPAGQWRDEKLHAVVARK